MDLRLPRDHLVRWGLRGGASLLDQAVFSGANFLMAVWLARLLSREEFGAFAVGFAFLTFLLQVYTSFALEPMSVLGPSRYGARLEGYLLTQLRLLFLLSLPAGIALSPLLGLDRFLGDGPFPASALVITVVGLPLLLFPHFMRRAFYLLARPALALVGSGMYSLALFALLVVGLHFQIVNRVTAVLLFALAGLICGLVLLLFLNRQRAPGSLPGLAAVLGETWSFGKWLLLSGVLIALATQSQIYLTGALYGIEEAGAVRILQTLIQPVMLGSTAFSALATPAIAADFAAGDHDRMRSKVLGFTLAAGGLALCYELFLILSGGPLNKALFGDKYLGVSGQIPVWGLVPVVLSFFWGGVIALQASQQPRAVLWIAAVWALFSLVPAVLLIPGWGAWGASLSVVIGMLAAFLATWILYWHRIHKAFPGAGRAA